MIQIAMTPTGEFTQVRGQPCRVWHGVSAEGVECLVYVALVAVRADQQSAEFDQELRKLGEGPISVIASPDFPRK